MTIQRKTKSILALIVSSVFLFQNCAIITKRFSKKSQIIPVTSNPQGAKIIVDGKDIGYAPLNLKLKKKKKSHVIRIEKQGYNLLEIRIIRKISMPSIVGTTITGCIYVGLGGLIGYGIGSYLSVAIEESDNLAVKWKRNGIIVGAILGIWSSISTLSSSGALYSLSPQEINVTLSKIEGKPQPNFILIDEEQFRSIKWIRIKCADSDGDDEIVNLD